LIGLLLLFRKTDIGIAMRATSDNETLASVSGIYIKRIKTAVWLIASGLAGLAGLLLGMQATVTPLMGFDIFLVVIAAAILGGKGSLSGAVIGAYVIGIAVTFSTAYLPTSFGGLGRTVAFIVLILVLLINPEGISGQKVSQ
jgi:branched-subunit amino acid ABC-type transport system permease component